MFGVQVRQIIFELNPNQTSGTLDSHWQFVNKIPKGSPTGSVGWKTIFSAVEMKRKWDRQDCPPWDHLNPGMQNADQQLDEEPDTSQLTIRSPYYERPLR